MQILTTVEALRAWRKQAGTLAFVPTMGNLHAGHIQLCHTAIERMRAVGGKVIVSIFVNPIQFGPGEDLDNYPRTFEADCEKLQAAGVDAVFHPSVPELYPQGEQQYFVEPPAIQNLLCGEFRPGHFRGVATVVTKLFNLVQPDLAVFGKKDYQQLMVIRRMVQQFALPIEIVGHGTERSADGLALSSRNSYLSEAERAEALQLSLALRALSRDALAAAHALPAQLPALEAAAMQALAARGWLPDYLTVRRRADLLPPQAGDGSGDLVALGAARLGGTRLIDNLEI